MRKLLLSTVSVAALVTLAACNDETADINDENTPVVEETAGIDTTGPAGDETAGAVADDDMTAQADADLRADPGAGEEPGVRIVDGNDTAAAGIEAELDVEEAQQALAEARSAIQVESQAEAVQALMNVERALGEAEETADARQAVDEARNAVVTGDFEAALAALDEAELAIETSGQASTGMPASDETTSSTSSR